MKRGRHRQGTLSVVVEFRRGPGDRVIPLAFTSEFADVKHRQLVQRAMRASRPELVRRFHEAEQLAKAGAPIATGSLRGAADHGR